MEPKKTTQPNWMSLAKTFMMVVSECKLLLQFVGTLFFFRVALDVQSSCRLICNIVT